MKYEVRCECGKPFSVTGADAGTSLKCGCGRTVEVPPLHQLRTAAGQNVLSPALRVETLLLEGKLPGTRKCAVCTRETDGRSRVAVECARGILKDDGSSRDQIAAGCLFGLLFGGAVGLFGANRIMSGESANLKAVGQDVAFTLPLPVCEGCQPTVTKPTELRTALRHIPDYAALLDAHPDAKIVLLG
ncbi:MAG: hypothetical protein C0467_23835 [Planctomycetaceae bacterium]|nr:hypothetical protein [Planctomycetaceae bacterium]